MSIRIGDRIARIPNVLILPNLSEIPPIIKLPKAAANCITDSATAPVSKELPLIPKYVGRNVANDPFISDLNTINAPKARKKEEYCLNADHHFSDFFFWVTSFSYGMLSTTKYNVKPAAITGNTSFHIPSNPHQLTALTIITGPSVRAPSPPSIYQLIPLPDFGPAKCFITTGAVTWNVAEHIPMVKRMRASIIAFGAMPIILPPTPVITGASIRIHRHASLWAIAPINILRKEGIRSTSVRIPAPVRDNPNLSMSTGSKGDKNDE